jgi:hypothetical protein
MEKNTNPNGWYLKQAYVDIKAVIHVVPRVQARKHRYFMMFTTHTNICAILYPELSFLLRYTPSL